MKRTVHGSFFLAHTVYTNDDSYVIRSVHTQSHAAGYKRARAGTRNRLLSLYGLNKINYFSTAKHLDSYDFATLYTSIRHDSLKQALKSLIKEAYRVRDSVFIVADLTGRAYWSNIPSSSSSRHSITEEQFVAYVEYLIDNIYVSIGNRVYRQCVGIPMGTDCAPLLANLFLSFYEYSYMRDLIKTDLVLAKKFNNTMRYIDDLLTLNNATFHSVIADIYPSELQLKKTTEFGTQLSYLDILITIENGKYSTAVYDKRDNFNFNIVNFHIFLLTSHLDLLMEFIFPS